MLFNEGWGQYDTEPLVESLMKRDPSRLVDNASGWTDMRVGDLIDMRQLYPGPDAPVSEPRRASVLGETGGLGLVVKDHTWSTRSWGYVMMPDERELASRYVRALKQVWELHKLRGLSAAIYTQTADVETEGNGLLTYDRAVVKIPTSTLLAANHGEVSGPPMKVILADALFGRANWRYTLEKPADDWAKPNFDASAWKEGPGGFGTTGTPGGYPNTTWDTSDIWLRRDFTLGMEDLSKLKLQIFHDEAAEVYLNGVLASSLTTSPITTKWTFPKNPRWHYSPATTPFRSIAIKRRADKALMSASCRRSRSNHRAKMRNKRRSFLRTLEHL